MSNKNEIQVTLTVRDDGSVVVKQFGKSGEEALDKISSSGKKTSGTLNTIKDSYVELIAKAGTAYMTLQKSMEFMEKGAGADQAEDSFRTLTQASGESADAIIANMKRATNSTIDDSQMMQKAVKAELLDFTGERIEQMAEMSRMAARSTGDSVGAAFDNIVNSISTNMPRALKQYGLITKEQQTLVSQAMAEGVEDVDLFSIAWENYNKQLEKTGPLIENDAERLQQYKAQIEDVQEAFGKLINTAAGWTLSNLSEGLSGYTATLAAMITGSSAPIDRWAAEKVGIKEVEAELARYQARLNAAQKLSPEKESAAAALKAAQEAAAQRKAELESLKALNKTYFAEQEAGLKTNLELLKVAGADEYLTTKESLEKRLVLMSEYSARTQQEIQAEAEVRSKADRDKLSDAQYVAEKMKALDADVAAKNRQLQSEKVSLALQTAQEDLKNLQSRLSGYQSYYEKLKALMDQNTEQEKKHLEELKALRQQSVDIDTSTAALIAKIKGTDSSLSAQQQYESARSALSSQYASALNLGGQDEISALEQYKQAVASLQAQFAQGIKGEKDIFGNASDIISAKQIAENAIADIERATQSQKNALAELTAEKEAQIEADRQWGQVLQQEALNAQAAMDNLTNTMEYLSAQIMSMQTDITLTGNDRVSSVVEGIINRIEKLHALAKQPITLAVQYSGISGSNALGYTDTYLSSPNTSSSLNLSSLNLDAGWSLTPYAEGTDYVPKTGPYLLHEGEAVITAAENKSGRGNISIGAIHINVPASAATKTGDDWRMITRRYIVPELKKLN